MRKKKGPCFHCGIDKTPLWRNGPPEKPVLCNACGSRYRLGKPLENYTPKVFQVIKNKKSKAKAKAKASATKENIKIETSNSWHSSAALEDYATSESSTSHIQNFVPIKQENRDENPVENWGSLWEIPSRKRSPVVYRSLTTIQKLGRDLHQILRDEDPLNKRSSDQGRPEDVLIYNIDINKLQIPSTEIGLGSILLKFPVTNSQDDHQQEIKPCSSNICAKVPIVSPSLENASDEVDGVQNENPPIKSADDDHRASPTMSAAGDG